MILFSNMCCTTICICDSNLKMKREIKAKNKFKSIEVKHKEEMSCKYTHIFFNKSFQKTKCKIKQFKCPLLSLNPLKRKWMSW